MAYIEERRAGYLVIWRDAETGKKTSRLVKWNTDGLPSGDPAERPFEITKDDARNMAEALAEKKRQSERAARKPFERVTKYNTQDYPGWQPQDFVAEDEEKLRFQNYLASLIDGGAITESAKHTYRHTLKNHIQGTKLGRKNVKFIGPGDIEDFWNAADVGDGARRNIAQGLRKGFSRALRRGLIEMNPLLRADIHVPSKKRRVRGVIQVLDPDELSTLAAVAATERDRLIVEIMGYAGLRAGECGGLARRDIKHRDGFSLQPDGWRIRGVSQDRRNRLRDETPVPLLVEQAKRLFVGVGQHVEPRGDR